ncbi:MAG TPA: DoxX family protein [Chthoniobacterales bacterium]
MIRTTRPLSGLYQSFTSAADLLQSPLLCLLRIYFFWSLFLAGKGKLLNIAKVSEFFASLHIPYPLFNAYLNGSLECFGSLLLIVGFGSRLIALPIVVTMIVAYVTADFPAVAGMLSDPDPFVKADPFPYLLAALVILAFGPGKFSVDALLEWKLNRRLTSTGSRRPAVVPS